MNFGKLAALTLTFACLLSNGADDTSPGFSHERNMIEHYDPQGVAYYLDVFNSFHYIFAEFRVDSKGKKWSRLIEGETTLDRTGWTSRWPISHWAYLGTDDKYHYVQQGKLSPTSPDEAIPTEIPAKPQTASARTPSPQLPESSAPIPIFETPVPAPWPKRTTTLGSWSCGPCQDESFGRRRRDWVVRWSYTRTHSYPDGNKSKQSMGPYGSLEECEQSRHNWCD